MRSRSLLGFVVASVAVWAALLGGAGAPQEQPPAETPQTHVIAYGIGFFLGKEVREGLEMDGVEVDLARVHAGFGDGVHGRTPRYDHEQMDDVLELLHQEMQERMVKRRLAEDPAFRKLHDDNLARSKARHEENAAREGVVTLDNGLQYRVVKSGAGPSPGPDATVVANYEAYGLPGHLVAKGEGVEVQLTEITAGASMIIQRMKVGDVWEVLIPPDLGHGPGGDPPGIGPNEAITGTIELLEVK